MNMKKFKNIFTLLVVALVGLSLTACSNDDLDTNQYQGGVSLNAYGPNPVMRGGTLRFLGSNLDQIAQVQIPGVSAITNIEVVKAGVPSEIRVQVPKDYPTPGLVTLVTKNDQTITTKTELNYIEGIEIESVTPSAMPGDIITIEGDYLNLVHSLAFADNVVISENDFTEHTRYIIKVAVPEEAKTGKIELYDADITILEDENNVEYQIITTEEAIEIGTPAISKLNGRNQADALGSITAKAGETVTITGTYFNVVDHITVGGYDVEEITVAEDGKTLTFALPAEAPDGDITLVCKSGVEVPVGTLETVKPTNCVASPNPVKAGQILQIDGNDMELVIDVEFADESGEYTINNNVNVINTRQAYAVTVPETAIEGSLKLVMANGSRIEVPFTLVKPTVTGYDNSSVSAGGALTIQGTDLDLVKTVQFGDGSDVVSVEGSADAIQLSVPMNAQSGAPILKLANGYTIENVPSINIEEAVFCYATELPGEDVELKAGESMTLTVANGDKLTAVEIDGANCQFVLVNSKTQLIIGIPDTAKKGSKVRLISSNGEITYTIDFIPNTEVTTVLWTGTADLAGWSWNWTIGDGTQGASNPNMFADMDLQEGDVIRIYATAYNDWWQVQFFDGHWSGQTEIGNATGLGNGNNINSGIYNLAEHDGAIEIPVTATLKEQLTTLTDWGYCWILQGEGVVITKIAVTHYTVLEQTLWSGDLDFNGWGINWTIGDGTAGASNPQMFVEAGLKAGMTIRLYITAYNDWWQVQFFDGHWGGQAEIGNATGLDNGNNINSGIYNLAEHNGAIEIPVTATLAEQLTTLTDWGYCWILQGEGCRATKITVE